MMEKRLLGLAICSTVLDKCDNWNIEGSDEQLQALSNAMKATRNFTDTLNNENTTSSDAMRALKEKHGAARRFEIEYGIRWPL
jgi:hypothetical protein